MHANEDVANYVVDYALRQGRPVYNSTLQKILYYIQAYILKTEHRWFMRGPIHRWHSGPVFPTVHQHFAPYGLNPISQVTPRVQFSLETQQLEEVPYSPNVFSAAEQRVMETVIEVCFLLSPAELVAASQAEALFTDSIDAVQQGEDRAYTRAQMAAYFSRHSILGVL